MTRLFLGFLFLVSSTSDLLAIEAEDYQLYRKGLSYMQVEGGRMAYLDAGNGDNVILLVHGVPTNSWLYVKVANKLVAKGYRVIAPDLLGYGASDKPDGYEVYNHQNQAKRLLALMDSLKIESWTHVCHDVGGIWTWELLRMKPEKVNKLVILNTIMYTEGFEPPMRFKKSGWAKFYTWLYKSAWGSKMMMSATLKNGLSSSTQLSKKRKEGYWLPMQEGGNKAIYYFFTQTCHQMPDNRDLFNSLKMPAMVIWGSDDPMLKWAPQAELVQESLEIVDQRVHVLDGAKHFIQEEQPDFIANQISGFISED